jgi:hypothetical protein
MLSSSPWHCQTRTGIYAPSIDKELANAEKIMENILARKLAEQPTRLGTQADMLHKVELACIT